MIEHRLIEYYHHDAVLEGFYAFDASAAVKPIILIAHDWSGRTEFFCQKAKELATMGYVGFAIDVYGKGKFGVTKEDKAALMQPLIKDRSLLQERLLAALAMTKQIQQGNSSKVAAIGYCFGGLCVLDLARMGALIKGVVSFHGALYAPEKELEKKSDTVQAKILALHGYRDPMVPMRHVTDFADEMTRTKADWQMHIYGQAMHAFTNPAAQDPASGLVYDAGADKHAWHAMQQFLQEVLM